MTITLSDLADLIFFHEVSNDPNLAHLPIEQRGEAWAQEFVVVYHPATFEVDRLVTEQERRRVVAGYTRGMNFAKKYRLIYGRRRLPIVPPEDVPQAAICTDVPAGYIAAKPAVIQVCAMPRAKGV